MNIDDTHRIERIERILLNRWWLFSGIILALVITTIVTLSILSTVYRTEAITVSADSRSIKNEATIEAAIKQMLIYQQETVQRWDKLSQWNPKVKVPKAVVSPPTTTTNKPLTDTELTRSPSSSKPTPTPSNTARKKPKPTSTPLPWWKRLEGQTH